MDNKQILKIKIKIKKNKNKIWNSRKDCKRSKLLLPTSAPKLLNILFIKIPILSKEKNNNFSKLFINNLIT